jgi:cell fate regulator YaaT (PSP1 superfamily)
MPLEEKPAELPPPKTIVVRYGYLKLIGEFPSDVGTKVGCGSKLVIRTERGTEIAEMLTTTCANGGCGKSVSREKLLQYIDASGGPDYPFSEAGRIIRVATVSDLAEQDKLNEQRTKHLPLARELVARHNLPMKIVEVEYPLGGERVLFYFTSEHRVDFRTMVRDLAHQLHTRIELRQVGARDDARLTADYEKCGQHCCCKQFLKVLTPVSMRSAKVQKATLDPAKISGRCGRLMCCLRYEDQTYEELRKKLPKRNTRVGTAEGEGWVVDGQILTQLVMVQYDDGKRAAVPMEKITAFDLPKPVMADGRVMQTPNDRPPENMRGDLTAPPGRGPQQRPMPGRPDGGPRGPGGPGNTGGPGAPRNQNMPGSAQGPRGPGAPAGSGGPGGPNAGRAPQGRMPQGGSQQQGNMPGRGPMPPRGPGMAGGQGGQRPPQGGPRGPMQPRGPMGPQQRGPMQPGGQGVGPQNQAHAGPPAQPPRAPQASDAAHDLDDLIADAMDAAPPQAQAPQASAEVAPPQAGVDVPAPANLDVPQHEAPHDAPQKEATLDAPPQVQQDNPPQPPQDGLAN